MRFLRPHTYIADVNNNRRPESPKGMASRRSRTMDQVCFGVEQCADGSVLVAAQDMGDASITRINAGETQSAQVIEFVRSRAPVPRVCVADQSRRSLNLALELGRLDAAEVFLLRPETLQHDQPLVLALASYVRHAA
jgi:hypothetical protein